MADARPLWPPPPAQRLDSRPDPRAAERTPEPLLRHARWIDRDHTAEEPREESPKLLWWILGGILIFAVFSVMIRMFLVL